MNNFDKYIDSILRAGTNASVLIKQLLAFARKGKYYNIQVDMHKVINETVLFLKHSVGDGIFINTDLNAKKYFVRGDPIQLQNAILNISINARDAVSNGGQIDFKTTNINLSKKNNNTFGLYGKYIKIDICDDGIGMDKKILSKIFEPFFTTKEDKGTGMGLPSVYGTIKNHKGVVLADSKLHKYTIITIYLPLIVKKKGELN